MKLGNAILFIAVGIWLAYSYPDWSAQAFEYIDAAYQWIKLKVNQLMVRL